MNRRITHLAMAAVTDGAQTSIQVVAVAQDGTVWANDIAYKKQWWELPPLPAHESAYLYENGDRKPPVSEE